jgi:hypothetical protein
MLSRRGMTSARRKKGHYRRKFIGYDITKGKPNQSLQNCYLEISYLV